MEILGNMLLFGIFAISFGFVSITAVFSIYRKARSKGYRPPGASAIVLAGFVIGFGAIVMAQPGNTTSMVLFLWRFFWLPLLISLAAMLAIIVVLPRREARSFGMRRVRFPFRRAGQVLLVLAVVTPITIAWMVFVSHRAESRSFPASVSLACMLALAGRYLIGRDRALHGLGMEEILEKDERPPVLYLRAFNQESQFFIMGTKEEYGAWAKSFHAAISQSEQNIGLTLEEYLSNDITRSIGPFVALGSPEDYLAPPGALRMYAKDDEWKGKFESLAQRAAAIIVEVSKSANLRWEFEYLRSAGLQEKLFVLTRPSMEGMALGWAFWGLLWKLKGIRTMSWREFASDVAHLGYEINFSYPGYGAVLTFDAHGEAFVLTTQANWPKEFVEPIRAWLTTREKIGRCVASACAKCGRKLYVREATTSAICTDCFVGAGPKARAVARVGWKSLGWLILLSPVLVIFLLVLGFPNLSERVIVWIAMTTFFLSIATLIYLENRS